jgi:glycosyltransferase involved in cell wall biosynthesis
LAYAGSPLARTGHKDLLNNILDAVLNIDEDGKRLQLNIAGITGNELLQYDSLKAKGLTRVPKVFNCKGWVSHGSATRMVGTADFSVLLRSPEKYAMAGFPTKFVESMAVGTPIITNITSDLADYLHYGDEGLICADHQSKSIEKQIRYALDLTDADKEKMRLKARQRAELSFDNMVYLDSFKCFLGSLDSVQ